MCLRNIVRIRVWGARWGDDRLLDLTSGVLAQQPVPTELVAQDWHWKAHNRDAVPLEQVAYFHLRSVWLWQLSLSLSLSLSHSLTHTHTHTHTDTDTCWRCACNLFLWMPVEQKSCHDPGSSFVCQELEVMLQISICKNVFLTGIVYGKI